MSVNKYCLRFQHTTKGKHIIQKITHLGFQIGHVNPKKIGIFEEHVDATIHTFLYVLLLKNSENKLISDGNKFSRVKLN